MSARPFGIVLALVISELLGLALGEWNYGLFRKTVPPAVVTNFNQGAAHIAFIVYGGLAGLAIFAWTLLAVFLSRFFKGGAPKQPPARSA